jgi:tetratricopeptide (TPR) repeat protein
MRNRYPYLNLALIYEVGPRKQEAVELYKQALECDPNYANAACYLGELYVELGQPDMAKASFQQALAAEPKHKRTLRQLKKLSGV